MGKPSSKKIARAMIKNMGDKIRTNKKAKILFIITRPVL